MAVTYGCEKFSMSLPDNEYDYVFLPDENNKYLAVKVLPDGRHRIVGHGFLYHRNFENDGTEIIPGYVGRTSVHRPISHRRHGWLTMPYIEPYTKPENYESFPNGYRGF